jgi:hypothetical protein
MPRTPDAGATTSQCQRQAHQLVQLEHHHLHGLQLPEHPHVYGLVIDDHIHAEAGLRDDLICSTPHSTNVRFYPFIPQRRNLFRKVNAFTPSVEKSY